MIRYSYISHEIKSYWNLTQCVTVPSIIEIKFRFLQQIQKGRFYTFLDIGVLYSEKHRTDIYNTIKTYIEII